MTEERGACLRNDFHGTSYETEYTRRELIAVYERVMFGGATDAEDELFHRAAKVLCPYSECLCAPWPHTRGEQG